MKTFYLFTIGITISFLLGCESPEKIPTQFDIVKKSAEDYIRDKLNDPESYEFVKLDLIDSVTYANNIEYRKNYFGRGLKYDRETIERQKGYKTRLPSMYDEERVIELENKIQKNEKIISVIDSLGNVLGEDVNKVASFTYLYSFRATNAMGAKVLNEYLIQTDPAPEYSIINMTDEREKMILNPNDFPGYKEAIKKYL